MLLPFLFDCSIWLASSSVQPKWATTRSSRGVISWVCGGRGGREEEEEEEEEGEEGRRWRRRRGRGRGGGGGGGGGERGGRGEEEVVVGAQLQLALQIPAML